MNVDVEEWKPIPGFEGYYEASTFGQIRSVDRTVSVVPKKRNSPYSFNIKGELLKLTENVRDGRRLVSLCKKSKYTCRPVAYFVILTFHGPRPKGMYVCHFDGNAKNDRLDNLYYGTPTENSADKIRHGTHLEGEAISWSKITEEDVRFIRSKKGVWTQQELSVMFEVCQSQISRIQRYKEWRHVD